MPPPSKKLEFLRDSGTLNAHPDKVHFPLFAQADFFDARDLLQIKYELLRAIEVDSLPISQAAEAFGLSRPTIYEARSNFLERGMEGLLPQKRGPKKPHKLTPDVLQHLKETQEQEPQLSAADLVRRVKRRFQVKVHPRTIEKALAEKAKRGRPIS
jgi:transposase